MTVIHTDEALGREACRDLAEFVRVTSRAAA